MPANINVNFLRLYRLYGLGDFSRSADSQYRVRSGGLHGEGIEPRKKDPRMSTVGLDASTWKP